MSYILFHDDCLTRMAKLDESSIDSIVTDPPYGLSFMGKGWDHGVPGVEFWTEAMRVAKPGAHLLAFGGTRTYHRLACAIEDAGWEIRDCVMWVYGSGFPKSLDVSKAIDKAAGAEREVVGSKLGLPGYSLATDKGRGVPCVAHGDSEAECAITAPATDAAKQWAGWGTALKPAWEPIIVARKPLDGTVAENVLRHGTGAINVDGCRVGTERPPTTAKDFAAWRRAEGRTDTQEAQPDTDTNKGRWPANLIHDGSEEVVGLLNEAARFFYCAKASKRDRDEGCEGLEKRLPVGGANKWTEQDKRRGEAVTRAPSHNHHPTVKPTELMRYLCRLVTPPGGIVLDPFMGSGSTGKAAILEGFQFVGIEKSGEYIQIAKSRLDHAEHPESVPAANDDGHQLELFDMGQYIREDAKK